MSTQTLKTLEIKVRIDLGPKNERRGRGVTEVKVETKRDNRLKKEERLFNVIHNYVYSCGIGVSDH